MVLVETGVEQPVAVGVTRQEVHGAAAERPPLVSAACRSRTPSAASRQAGSEAAAAGSERRACVRACARSQIAAERRFHPPGQSRAGRERRARHVRVTSAGGGVDLRRQVGAGRGRGLDGGGAGVWTGAGNLLPGERRP